MYGAGIVLFLYFHVPQGVLASASTPPQCRISIVLSGGGPGIQLNLTRNQNYKEEIKESALNRECFTCLLSSIVNILNLNCHVQSRTKVEPCLPGTLM